MPSVTRKTQASRAERRDLIKARLLAAVESLLAEGENFTELSVERLVSLAGVSRSTFYVYFEDKGELIRAWLTEIISELDVAAQGWWSLGGERAASGAATVSWADLRVALNRVVLVYRPHTTLMAAAFDAAAYDPAVRDQVDAMMQRNIAGLRKHNPRRPGQRLGGRRPAGRADRRLADLDGRARAASPWSGTRRTTSWPAWSTPTPASSGTPSTPAPPTAPTAPNPLLRRREWRVVLSDHSPLTTSELGLSCSATSCLSRP